MNKIILSLLDTDMYKFTVNRLIFNRFANLHGTYTATCRNAEKINFFKYVTAQNMRDAIKDNLTDLSLTKSQLEFLKTRDYLTDPYVSFLSSFKFDLDNQIQITENKDGSWILKATGPLLYVQMYETFLLSIMNRLFSLNYMKANGISEEDVILKGKAILDSKIKYLSETNPPIIEFGTRRRFSADWQRHVIQTLGKTDFLSGTSNMHFAHENQLKEIGTFGHEFPMAMQGIKSPQWSQREAFKIWLDEFKGSWGIALTDTLGHDKFLQDFTFDLAKGYDGVRHDSGNPFTFAESILTMYKGYNIDPKTKRIVFSDGLDPEETTKLYNAFKDKIAVSFGIGTNLTNDLNLPVPQVVMKITECNFQPVAKISENIAKISCEDDAYVQYLQHAIAHNYGLAK